MLPLGAVTVMVTSVEVPGPPSGMGGDCPVATPAPAVSEPDITAFGSDLVAETVTLVTLVATFTV